MINIKVHDIVNVSKQHKDPTKSYYSSNQLGLVLSFDGATLRFRKADGTDVEEQITAEDTDYVFIVSEGSEFEYREELEKEVRRLLKQMDDLSDRYNELSAWRTTFIHQISVFGRMLRWIDREVSN